MTHCDWTDCPYPGEWTCRCRGVVCLGHADRCLDCQEEDEP